MSSYLKRLLIGVAFVGTLALGTLGFLSANPGYTFWTAVLAALQLFALNSGVVDGPVPWTLEAARWIAFALSGAAALGIARELAADSILRGRLFIERVVPAWVPLRRQCLIVGLGRKGIALITDLKADPRSDLRVLAVDRDPERVAIARSLGIEALVADGTSEETLRNLPWRRISWTTLLMKGDEPNVTAALEIIRQRGHADTQVAVHVPTLQLRNLLARQDALKARGVRLFNHYERLARRTLLAYPVELQSISGEARTPDLLLGLQTGEPALEHVPHVFIRPSRDFTPALVASLARGAHFPRTTRSPWSRIRVILAGDDAEAQREAIQALHPALRREGEFALIDFDVLVPSPGQAAAEAVADCIATLPAGTPSTVFLDVHEPGAALLEALAVLDRLGVTATELRGEFAGSVRCIFDFAEEPSIMAFLAAHPALRRYMYPLPSLADCCGGGVLFDAEDRLDALARRVHAHYDPEGRMPWDTLSLELQESNRAAADHVGVVLRWLRANDRDARAPEFTWDADDLDILAECEHRRWAAQKLMAGWEPDHSLGEGQDKARKRHGCLDRRYDELSEEMKERDRANVRAIPELLALLKGDP
jgi:voltage-gated potassium channel Kch